MNGSSARNTSLTTASIHDVRRRWGHGIGIYWLAGLVVHITTRERGGGGEGKVRFV